MKIYFKKILIRFLRLAMHVLREFPLLKHCMLIGLKRFPCLDDVIRKNVSRLTSNLPMNEVRLETIQQSLVDMTPHARTIYTKLKYEIDNKQEQE